ncbi:hypothetical protein SHKM778_79140 [Streptomyces sp. KM77-8]|uniref:Dihydrofolate synthase/folylpolyglutamate synthase n=1 Tax=Streptomyces haneummycinicus TaxID=3074435 RepID=A0AAT9HV34_9ACTN
MARLTGQTDALRAARRLGTVSERPESPGPDPDDTFDDFTELVEEETRRDPDLAVIEAGSRTLRTQGGLPLADVPARPEDPEVDRALREVEAELADRWGETKLEPSVARIAALMDVLGEPQRSYPSIHITGTNGKTSTARMIEALLGAFELRTGRYTSPHVQSVTERISLDGAPVSAERFIETYQDIKPYVEMVDSREEYRLSFFEVLTGMAYAAFADAPVDVAVVEVGMGGSWDATNVIDGGVAVVTPIDLDHTDRLGGTPGEIAVEKAGIVKRDATVIMAQQPVDAAQVLLKKAVEVDATVAREGLEFGVVARQVAVGGQLVTLRGLGGEYPEVYLPLHGAHQAHNAAVALAAVEAFFGVGAQRAQLLDVDTVRKAFAAVASRAGSRSYGVPRPSSWTPPTTRRARGRRPPRSGRRSSSATSSAWSARAATRTYAGCWRRSSRSSPRSSSPGTPATARWTSTSWRRSPSRCSARTASRSSPGCPTPWRPRSRWPRRRASSPAAVCSSPVPSSPSARPDCSWGGAEIPCVRSARRP